MRPFTVQKFSRGDLRLTSCLVDTLKRKDHKINLLIKVRFHKLE